MLDRVIYLSEPYETLTRGQASMAKGVGTVFAELVEWLDEHRIPVDMP